MTDDLAKPDDTVPGPTEAAPIASPPPANPMPGEPARPSKAALPVAVVAVVVAIVAAIWAWRSVDAANGEITALQGRLDTLEQRPVAPPPPSLQPVENRLAALEKRPVPDLAPLDKRMTELENKPPPQASLDNAGHTEIAALAGRVDQITARQTQLGTQEQTDIAKLADQVSAQDQRVAAAAKTADQAAAAAAAAAGQVTAAAAKAGQQIDNLAERQARTAQLGAAAVALDSGRPLGAIPNAPPALAQFATKAPPTDAALRLGFDQAAEAAQQASRPAPSDKPLLDRIWARAQSSVTVKQGDRVVLGSPISGYLQDARRQLDAGDLAGAVKALDGLDGPAAAAMTPWRQQAQSLLDARAALLTAAHG